jgi:hypothetical protein
MDVYLIPIGSGRFELYYEAADDAGEGLGEATGFFAKWKARFAAQLREAEQSRLHTDDHQATFSRRVQRKMMRWIAERVASQRLLWHLRSEDVALLHTPDTLPAADAEQTLRRMLQDESDRHRSRLAIHSVGLLLSLPVAFLPGPNFLGYFFTFTVAGHFLSWQGARRGLRDVKWTYSPSAELTEIGHALALDRAGRHRAIHDVAGRMHLPRLARFLERVAAPSA